MAITAAMVKELRERTGAGMMECKKALTESKGDMETAIETLRRKGAASAEKKAGRITAEGIIARYSSGDGKQEVLVEVNCETDFVAKDDSFVAFASKTAECIANNHPADVAALMDTAIDDSGQSVETARQALITKIGENISVRRFEDWSANADSRLNTYLHGARIGVLVETSGGRDDLGRDLAMHVAASSPMCVDESGIDPELLEKEKQIFAAQARESGKPEDIIEKMVTGRIKKFTKENTLLGQHYVKDQDQSVAKLLESEKASVARFLRMEVGEGIEKREEDFASEVAAQLKDQKEKGNKE
ncbi:MAG: translation elongation factor Ts [Gammaproteobacteria bacterium]|nr:translation elongation factor Ts [Gammaproteobacteria bacterium]